MTNISKMPFCIMYKYLSLSFIYCCFFNNISAFDGLSFSDVRSKGLGDAGVAAAGFANPAGLSFSERGTLSASYENRFGIKELSETVLTGMYPNKILNVGICFARFGYEYYNENLVGLSVCRKLSSNFSLGVRFDYFGVYIADSEGIISAFTTDVGVQWKPGRQLMVGLSIDNPVFASFNTGKKIPTILKAGLQYSIVPNFLLVCELNETFHSGLSYKVGTEYSPAENLFFRIGMSGKPFMPTFGLGYSLKNTGFDLFVRNHSRLGLISGIELSYCF